MICKYCGGENIKLYQTARAKTLPKCLDCHHWLFEIIERKNIPKEYGLIRRFFKWVW
jgi:hypothetical protein